MTAIQLKSRIQERLNRTNDLKLLETVYKILREVDEVRKFTPEQHALVMRGLEQVRNGEVTSQEEADREIEEWLREK